jgi:hypothetical protein
MFDANRRKYPRANYPCNLTVWFDNEVYETVLANTANIGSGGLSVHIDRSIKSGVCVDVQLTFPKTTTPFKCRGRVVRCQSQEGGKFYNIGIQFEAMTELQQSFLDGKVSELIAAEQGEES